MSAWIFPSLVGLPLTCFVLGVAWALILELLLEWGFFLQLVLEGDPLQVPGEAGYLARAPLMVV